ncbi:AAA family ATPase [Nonomuraea sp. NPDC049129]|uniref:AAA family ATPase n=1 Tax=Nonomuraea sp. NPDC049129 TaxID=3155272 RepID=UPI00340BE096
MLTRIEIDGFKSFLDFELDVPPFLALVGPNSSGKSNLLDAFGFARAALVAGRPGLSTSNDPLPAVPRGKPQELFHRPVGSASVSRFTIGVEADMRASDGRDKTYASVTASKEPADWALTAVPGWSDKIWPQEARSWHFHLPDLAAIRKPVTALDRGPLAENGANLAAVLGRMSLTGELGELMVDLAALLPDVTGVRPVLDERQQEWSFDILVDREPMPGRLASDGTLRVLALLAALYDRTSSGPLMVEEIENGLYPSRLGELLMRIAQRVGAIASPWQQVILTSHSPVVVSTLYRTAPESLVFLEAAWRAGGGHPRSRLTLAKPVRAEGEPGAFTSPRQVRSYLSAVEQAA